MGFPFGLRQTKMGGVLLASLNNFQKGYPPKRSLYQEMANSLSSKSGNLTRLSRCCSLAASVHPPPGKIQNVSREQNGGCRFDSPHFRTRASWIQTV